MMKARHKTKNSFSQTEAKNLTLGELVATTYSACGKQMSPKILQLAMESHLVLFKRPASLGYFRG
jgi:hypothetical protein